MNLTNIIQNGGYILPLWTEHGSRDFLDCVVKFSDFQNLHCKPRIMVVFTIFFGCQVWLENDRGPCAVTLGLGVWMKCALSHAGLDRVYLQQRMEPSWAMRFADSSPIQQ